MRYSCRKLPVWRQFLLKGNLDCRLNHYKHDYPKKCNVFIDNV
ncbi:hypothetical protein HMPREF1051_0229 [Neisseria sicca VK64]|uniref:Uncharacterized protein n=1 Tax=Neisseria sicca VK64 TaxID=1095748 RepID=I2NWR2_NEISI|nr:hypothetical protein HMPREF1051_0229 [Neisseria sicca VK64]